MRNDHSKTEETCRLFGELVDRLIAKGLLTSGAEAPRLQLVTASNAHEFRQAAKRRGRPPKVRTGGNVVAFRQRPQSLAPGTDRVTTWMREMVASMQQQRAARRPHLMAEPAAKIIPPPRRKPAGQSQEPMPDGGGEGSPA
jgi:hypothetical protein